MLAAMRLIALSVLYAVFSCSVVQAQDPAQVQGLLATRVHFSAESGEKVAAATLKLLASCTASGAVSEQQWQDAPVRTCHLHPAFAKARLVTMYDSQALEVDELVVAFPLSSARLWVRSGDQYHWFAKFRPDLPHPQPDTDRGALRSVRRFLSEAGVTP